MTWSKCVQMEMPTHWAGHHRIWRARGQNHFSPSQSLYAQMCENESASLNNACLQPFWIIFYPFGSSLNLFWPLFDHSGPFSTYFRPFGSFFDVFLIFFMVFPYHFLGYYLKPIFSLTFGVFQPFESWGIMLPPERELNFYKIDVSMHEGQEEQKKTIAVS